MKPACSKPASRRRLSRRQRRIWFSVAVTFVSTGVTAGVVVWVEAQRNTDLADPTAGVTSAFRRIDAATPDLSFRDVAEESGIVGIQGPGSRTRRLPEDTAGGLAWGDYDGDGDPDLYVVSFPDPARQRSSHRDSPSGVDDGANRLYRNDGGKFVDVTARAGVADTSGFGMGASFADYDGDGNLDLYVTNYGPNRLFRNRGDGSFDEIAERAGVADSSWSTGMAWGDYDRDGDLDLYVCNYLSYDVSDSDIETVSESNIGNYSVPFSLNPNAFDPEPNRLYRNRGDGTFEERAREAGVENSSGRSLAATFCDLDGDGWLDLYVNNDVSTNKLFRSSGEIDESAPDVYFLDLSTLTGTADPRGSMGLSITNLNAVDGGSDRLPDLFISHWVAQENALYVSVRGGSADVEYRDRTRQLRLGELSIDTVGWGSAFADLDLDGRIDLLVANGSTLERKNEKDRLRSEPVFLFWNGGKVFHEVAARAGDAMTRLYDARGLAVADYDQDGDVDLAVGINRGRPILLRNDTATANRSITVVLEGADAVRFGARVTVRASGRAQTAWFGADVSFLSQHGTDLVFGLGDAGREGTVTVLWGDGQESEELFTEVGRVVVRHPRVSER